MFFPASHLLSDHTVLPPTKCDFESNFCDWTQPDTGWKWERWGQIKWQIKWQIKSKPCLKCSIFWFPSFQCLSRKRGDGMGSEFGPEHDHNEEATSMMQQHPIRFVSLFSSQNSLLLLWQIRPLLRRASKVRPKSLTKVCRGVSSSGTCLRSVFQEGKNASDTFSRVTWIQFSRWMWQSRWGVPGTLCGGNLTLMWRPGSRVRYGHQNVWAV